jgi:hypothetical protein
MKKTLNNILLLAITGFITGCKLAVIVVEGGEVQSTGSGTCVASAICIVDVSDSYFSETFSAVPDPGWYFQKWNAGIDFSVVAPTFRHAVCLLKGMRIARKLTKS